LVQDDGNIVIKPHITDSSLGISSNGIMEGSGQPTINPSTIEIYENGIQNDIIVNRGNNPELPMTMVLELETDDGLSLENKTASWLLYNEASEIEKPDPFYKVRFINNSDWAGVGKKGSVLDVDASGFTSKRMNW
jgi:hypothetical protein